MGKLTSGTARRATIAPPSRFQPKTWMKIRWTLPWLTAGTALPLAAISPSLGFMAAAAGAAGYMMASTNCPEPLFPRKQGEQAIHLGTDEYGLPIMVPVKDLTRHGIIMGTTGSGKTTLIRTMADAAMKLGGGFCFIDGKADVTDTYAVLYEIVQNADRLEDLLVLNFLNPHQSHTFNFLKYGEADFLTEIMTGFMKEAQGDQAYWQNQGKELMRTVLCQLVYKRDHSEKFDGYILTFDDLQKHLNLQHLIGLMDDPRIPERDEKDMPVKARLQSYLDSLGPWQDLRNAWKTGKPVPQSAGECTRQHGFYLQQWREPMGLITGPFYPIFHSDAPEIDMVDVVTNSRILIVLLPALAYSALTLKSLGRLVLNTFKIAADTAIGKQVEGNFAEVRESVKRNRPSVPFVLIPDEYGSYAVEGFDSPLAQFRSLGLGVFISVQEFASLVKASEVDAKRTLGNTNIKIIMKLEDTETIELIQKRAGEMFFMMPRVRNEGNLVTESLGNWDGDYGYEKMSCLDLREVTGLKIGEGYIIYGEDIRKFKARYIPPADSVKSMSLMKFVKKSSKFIHNRIKAALEETKKCLDEFTATTYRLFEQYAIGMEEERYHRKYIKGRNSLFLQSVLHPMDEPHKVFEAMEANRFFNNIEEEARIKSVVQRRIEYEKFLQAEWRQFKSSPYQKEMMKCGEDTVRFVRDCLVRLEGHS